LFALQQLVQGMGRDQRPAANLYGCELSGGYQLIEPRSP
jgi:hypothetical protein